MLHLVQRSRPTASPAHNKTSFCNFTLLALQLIQICAENKQTHSEGAILAKQWSRGQAGAGEGAGSSRSSNLAVPSLRRARRVAATTATESDTRGNRETI